MKNSTIKNMLRKTIFALILIILLFSFVIPQYSFADGDDEGNGVVGSLLKEVVQLFASIGDVVMGALNKFMLGSDEFFSAMLDQDDHNLEEGSGSWLVEGIDRAADEVIEAEYMDEKTFLLDASIYKVPNMLYSPENIFANNIALLDINFLNPNTYTSIIEGDQQADKMAQSAAGERLKVTISSWYKSFRNIAIVALLSVLVYLGIRILLSSTAADKAKYKESIYNWFIALCLVFVIHFIMSGILMITENFNALFSSEIDKGIVVEATHSDESKLEAGKTFKFKTNLIGLARFKAQADQWQDATAYTIIYLALVIYTCIFTFMYFKRFLYMAFFTMIAPLVALTYPIDKAGDGKAQAFNIWFKEYTMNAIIQPVHLILYSVFVSSAIELAVDSPIYAVVAIAFLIPAEKFIKKMFGLDKAESPSGFGSFAGGAIAMKGLQTLSNLGKGKSGKSSGEIGSGSVDGNEKIRFPKTNSSAGDLSSFNERNEKSENPLHRERIAGNGNSRLNGLYDDRDEWERMANDENASDLDREEARQQLAFIDEDIDREMGNQPVSGVQRETPEISDKQENTSMWNKVKNTAGTARRKISKFSTSPVGVKLKSAGKFTARTMARTAGIMGGATVGLAAGITTGDMSKALSFAATGAMAGDNIGKNLANASGRMYSSAMNAKNSLQDTYNEKTQGYEHARNKRVERENNAKMKQYLSSKEERAKAKDFAGKIGYDGNIRDLMETKAEFYKAGITDEDLINNSIKASYKESGSINGKSTKEYLDIAGYISDGGFTKEDIRDEEKMRKIEERVQHTIKNPNVQNEVMTKMADLLGEKGRYEEHQRAGRSIITSPSNQRRRTTRTNNPQQEQRPRMNRPNQ